MAIRSSYNKTFSCCSCYARETDSSTTGPDPQTATSAIARQSIQQMGAVTTAQADPSLSASSLAGRTPIAQIDTSKLGQKVSVDGWVVGFTAYVPCTFMTIHDGASHYLRIDIPSRIPNYREIVSNLRVGDKIQASGTIGITGVSEPPIQLNATSFVITEKNDSEAEAADY